MPVATRRAWRARGALLALAALAADAALAAAACSSEAPDAGADAGDATAQGDAPDAARDAALPPADAGREAGGRQCSPVKGTCDIVLQDCPPQEECVVRGSSTACVLVATSQQLPIGRGCCPNAPRNPCLPGLTCVGNACVDGGATTTGRCSPACCQGDDLACGKSDPEGISGTCDLVLVSPGTTDPLYYVCTYRQRCKPFELEPCKPGETCIVEDAVGTASCVDSFGKTNRQPCTFGNECADGLVCLGAADAAVCHFACLLPGSTPPFDASVQDAGPGTGGCAPGELCSIRLKDKPVWLGACALDGG